MRSLSLSVCLLAVATANADPTLTAGFGEADISPKLGGEPVYMAGFGQDRKAESIHDPIMARAVVLSDGEKKIAIVTVDVVGLFPATTERVHAKLTGFEKILINATHNHEGPDTIGIWGPNPFTTGVDPKYLASLEAGVVEAIQQADKGRKAVTARIGKTNAPELLRDSRVPDVKHDELVALRFDDPETSKPLGLLVQWNCHPETLGGDNKAISADFVPYTVAELRERYGCPTVCVTGTVGGLMTQLGLEILSESGESLKDGTFEKTERYGKLVGIAAAKAIEKAEPVELTPFRIRSRKLLLPVDNKLYQLGWQMKVFNRPVYAWDEDSDPEEPTPSKSFKEPIALQTEVGYWSLGDVGIAVIPGEIYPELVLGKVPDPAEEGVDFPDAPVEPSIYGVMTEKHKMIVGLGNDEIGYILPLREWDEQPPFGYGRKKAPYGEINSLGPKTGPLLCEAFKRLAEGE